MITTYICRYFNDLFSLIVSITYTQYMIFYYIITIIKFTFHFLIISLNLFTINFCSNFTLIDPLVSINLLRRSIITSCVKCNASLCILLYDTSEYLLLLNHVSYNQDDCSSNYVLLYQLDT